MNKETNRLDCAIVEDLLPLYHDGVVNVITAEIVENHLKECELCKKEYESLSADIGEKKEKSTKEVFTIMIKKKRIKQFFVTVMACILSCALLSGVYYFLTEANIVEITDVQVKEAYRYSDADGKEKFYVYFSCEPSRKILVEHKDADGEKFCEATLKGTVLYPSPKELYGTASDPLTLSAEKADGTVYADKLVFAGQTVWTKEGNADDEIPAYVYAYDLYENSNNDEFGDSDTCGWSWNENTVTIEHAKYGRLTWNMEGKLIDGSPEKEKEILDLYK